MKALKRGPFTLLINQKKKILYSNLQDERKKKQKPRYELG